MRRAFVITALAAVVAALVALPVVESLAAQPDETVYVTRTGAKYHREGCSSLRSSAIPMKLSEAAQRYGACMRCRPPVPKETGTPKDEDLQKLKEPAKQSAPMASGRCQAITRKGTQCSRRAQPGRSYCYQHP